MFQRELLHRLHAGIRNISKICSRIDRMIFKHAQARDMVRMRMRDQHRIQIFSAEPRGRKCFGEIFLRRAAVNHQKRILILQQKTVSSRAGCQHRKLHHTPSQLGKLLSEHGSYRSAVVVPSAFCVKEKMKKCVCGPAATPVMPICPITSPLSTIVPTASGLGTFICP